MDLSVLLIIYYIVTLKLLCSLSMLLSSSDSESAMQYASELRFSPRLAPTALSTAGARCSHHVSVQSYVDIAWQRNSIG